MKFTADEKNILRELAIRYVDIANSEKQLEQRSRMRAVNDLKCVRPPVLINEIPWHEMDIDNQLALHCTDPFARQAEQLFRRALFQWKYFQCDLVVENAYRLIKSNTRTPMGPEIQEHTIAVNAANPIVSHEYIDQLSTEADLEKLHIPVVSCHPEKDNENMAAAQELFGDILPVELHGVSIHYAPWDLIAFWRGVEPILFDLADRPEFLHKIMEKVTEAELAVMTQFEQFGLLDSSQPVIHCTPGYTDALPAPDYKGGSHRLKDVWFRSMAQMFSTVSPDMHEEFDLAYSKPLMDRCGLVYYGCCEPLDNKISLLKKIPNLRKIGVSPWANVRSCAEQIGKDYVFACKPNPANVADITDPEVIRAEISGVVEACLENGCPLEFVLKDISTVGYKPQNLMVWAETVSETLDRYYK